MKSWSGLAPCACPKVLVKMGYVMVTSRVASFFIFYFLLNIGEIIKTFKLYNLKKLFDFMNVPHECELES